MNAGHQRTRDLGEVAARLRAERSALLARITDLDQDMATFFDASRDSNADDEHDPEGQTIAYERSQLAAVTQQAREHLVEVDAALAQRIGLVEIGTRPGPAWMSAQGWHYTEWQLTRGRWEGALCAPI